MKIFIIILIIGIALVSCKAAITQNREKLANKYWKLTELNGKAVVTDPAATREPHLIFQDTAYRVGGHAGCNLVSGHYELSGRKEIDFSQMISTKMFCEKMMETETAFLGMLEKAESFSFETDSILILYDDNEKALAKFQWIPGKQST